MSGVRGVFPVLVGVLVLSATAHADKFPRSETDVPCRQLACNATSANLPNDSSALGGKTGFEFLDLQIIHPDPRRADFKSAAATQRLRIRKYKRGSFFLYLPDLVSPDTRITGQNTKKRPYSPKSGSRFYGGFLKTGYGIITHPYSLNPVPVWCFVLPDEPAERLTPQYHLKTTLLLRRKSLFAPDELAYRGPPSASSPKSFLPPAFD